MSYEELVESRKRIGDMTKEELFIYCNGLLDEVWSFEKRISKAIKLIYEYQMNDEEKIYDKELLDILKGVDKK